MIAINYDYLKGRKLGNFIDVQENMVDADFYLSGRHENYGEPTPNSSHAIVGLKIIDHIAFDVDPTIIAFRQLYEAVKDQPMEYKKKLYTVKCISWTPIVEGNFKFTIEEPMQDGRLYD